LEGLFDLAVCVAKGEVKRLRDEDGNEYKVTPKQREKWACIAAYTGQVMHNLTMGYDERQLQTDVKRLEQMVNEVKRRKAEENNRATVALGFPILKMFKGLGARLNGLKEFIPNH
jgi:DNA-binding MarR family transcriptional regulator